MSELVILSASHYCSTIEKKVLLIDTTCTGRKTGQYCNIIVAASHISLAKLNTVKRSKDVIHIRIWDTAFLSKFVICYELCNSWW